ncbi:MAG: hypothetical protein M3P85_12055 [Actinomycetota bacterium]|nr:hypothetical protein [Actinomycetota bacterium]
MRDGLIKSLDGIVRNYRAGRWEPSELNGGKLCEVVYTILRGHADGAFPSKPSKPKNMVDACRALEGAGAHLPRSLRVQIPRVLVALYEIRNNRGVGHVGGDVDPNHMDATAVVAMAKWVVAEVIRLFHAVDTATATTLVDALVSREVPVVWEVGGKRRVLAAKLTNKEKTLLLLYSHTGPIPETDLRAWVEHTNASVYRRDILRPAHKAKLIEYDTATGTVELSPVGVQFVEQNLPLSLVT